ncbi:hypothetical protein, conserved [Plasmodium gonderi]|uniref:RAP domain-containing protein n=1 Tax=Plasmodium gonderi TaxID=77519 RepID=A0A1Y1JH46_PLAGO|nr:hypothetical protein, conserved [Plasmodium gonderi]GAW81846.1 hypothetical protein, conserved [Plasmodium gonderi]
MNVITRILQEEFLHLRVQPICKTWHRHLFLLSHEYAKRINAVIELKRYNFHTYNKITKFERKNSTIYNSGDELEETLKVVDKILKESNFYIYVKRITNDEVIPKECGKDVDTFKMIRILNKILLLSKGNADPNCNMKINIWQNPIFLDFLSYMKLKIPSFNYHEMFLFVLCFSKIQFMPQMLIKEVLLIAQEKTYVNNFFKEDTNKFFQFFFALSCIQNVRGKGEARSLFINFANSFVQVILDFLSSAQVEEETTQEEDEAPNERSSGRSINLECYMLLCSSMHNANIRNVNLLNHVSKELLEVVNEKRWRKKEEEIETGKRLINIYFTFASLGCENYHFYDKLNGYLYNLVDELPFSSCLTLLLSISTLKEQKYFNFPLCILSLLEKKFSHNFYALDAKDLLLLIYLFTYLKLYLSNFNSYAYMLDYLLNFHHFEASNEDERVKLFQIYVTLVNSDRPNESCEVYHTKRKWEESNILSDQDICHSEMNDKKVIHKDIKGEDIEEKHIHRKNLEKILRKNKKKMEINMPLDKEKDPLQYEDEIQNEIENLLALLHHFSGKNFHIQNLNKNGIILNYYLSHIHFDIEKVEGNKKMKPQKVVINFDTDITHISDDSSLFFSSSPSFDIYTNMKRQHLTNLNIKWLSIKLHQWKDFTHEEKKKFIEFKLSHICFQEPSSVQ